MSTRKFLVAAAQMCSGDDLEANLAVCRRLAERAAQDGVRLLVLPENFAYLGVRERDKFAHAEVVEGDSYGPILAAIAAMARDHGLWIIAGGMPEIPRDQTETLRVGKNGVPELGRTYNACVTVSPDGEIAAVYRKIHLFDVAIPDKAVLRESDTTLGGIELVTVETPLCRVGLSICYDLRFPELYRDLVIGHGAQVLVVPAAFTAYTGAAHWHTLLRCRAIENQCYVIAAAQYGRHNERRHSYGHSLVVDPWGTVLAEIDAGEGLATAEIDLEHLDATRTRMPCLEHQRLFRAPSG